MQIDKVSFGKVAQFISGAHNVPRQLLDELMTAGAYEHAYLPGSSYHGDDGFVVFNQDGVVKARLSDVIFGAGF